MPDDAPPAATIVENGIERPVDEGWYTGAGCGSAWRATHWLVTDDKWFVRNPAGTWAPEPYAGWMDEPFARSGFDGPFKPLTAVEVAVLKAEVREQGLLE